MKILLAFDKFKNCLSAIAVCQIIAKQINLNTSHSYISLPLSDGGEGFLSTINSIKKTVVKNYNVTGPLKKKISVPIGFVDNHIAIVDLSTIVGLHLLPKEKRNPMYTTTKGLGEAIKFAIENCVDEIWLGVGGSSTNDAAAGALQELGMRFLDENNSTIDNIVGKDLIRINKIDDSNFVLNKHSVKIKIFCDVRNPMIGNFGASKTYANQKGANKNEIELLENGMQNFIKKATWFCGKDYSDLAGTGAAGGIAGGFLFFCNAELLNGFDSIAKIIGLEKIIENSDLILTGEGKYDSQSKFGKVPHSVACLAKKYNKKVYLLAGMIQQVEDLKLFDSVNSVFELAASEDDSIENARGYLIKIINSLILKKMI